MHKLKNIMSAIALIFVFGLLTSAQAQRTVTYVTNSYQFKANQIALSSLGNDTYAATFSGEGKAFDSKLAADLKPVTITVIYTTASNGTATVVGGTWSVVTTNKDRSSLTVGGAIASGGMVMLKPGTTAVLSQGPLVLTLLPSDPDMPTSGVLSASLDKSSPARASGTLIMTYPVIQ